MRGGLLLATLASLFFSYKVLTGDFAPLEKLVVTLSALAVMSWALKHLIAPMVQPRAVEEPLVRQAYSGDASLETLLASVAELNRQITHAVNMRHLPQVSAGMEQLAQCLTALKPHHDERSLEVLFHALADATLASTTGMVPDKRVGEAAADTIVAIGAPALAYVRQFPPDPRAPVRHAFSAVIERLNACRPLEDEAVPQAHPSPVGAQRTEWDRLLEQAASYVAMLISRGAPGREIVQVVERVLQLAEEGFGTYSEQAAVVLRWLGREYRETGSPQALPCLRRALTVHRRVYGSFTPPVAIVLSNLGGMCGLLGRVDEAESYYREALAIDTLAYGERHPETLTDRNNLALLLHLHHYDPHHDNTTRQYLDEARETLQYILQVETETRGGEHPVVGTALLNWAGVCARAADGSAVAGDWQAVGASWQEAERAGRRALDIYEQTTPQNPIAIASALGNLAESLVAQGAGHWDEARRLYQRVLEIDEREYGPTHPDVATDLTELALASVRLEQTSEAFACLARAARLDDQLLGQVFAISSESHRMRYLETIRTKLDLFLALVVQHLAQDQWAVQAALDLVLRRKAIGAEALAAQREAILGGRYPALLPKMEALTALQRQAALEAAAETSGTRGPHREHRLLHIRGQIEQLETELAHQIPELQLQHQLRTADHRAVAQALPAGAALVEFICFTPCNFLAVRARGEFAWQPVRYLAFVLHADQPDAVQMLDLGLVEPIDQTLATWRREIEMAGRPRSDNGSGRPALEPAGLALRAVFAPLLATLPRQKHLFLAPDGDLSLLPFEVLPADDGSRLIDRYPKMSYLSVGRDVLRFQAASPGQPTPPLVLADPNFNLARVPSSVARDRSRQAASPSRRTAAEDRSALRFDRLPGTRVEGELIAQLLGVTPWLQDEVLEARLKACRAPWVLHCATHGFFHGAQEPSLSRKQRGLGGPGVEPSAIRHPEFVNPLFHSGLALAGANTASAGGALPAEAEDGLLTAADVSGLDLQGTELVVLAACSTGLGAVRTGEGVFGLRRTFALAGAKTLVMSLWDVPDLATTILMVEFYHNLLTRKFPRDEALQAAKRFTREVTVGQLRDHWLTPAMIEQLAAEDEGLRHTLEALAQRPDDARPFAQPWFWGAFICQGEPDPLRPFKRQV